LALGVGGGAEGCRKKNTNTHVHVQNPSKKHPPTSFFVVVVLTCFFISFSGTSQQVEFKNTPNKF
jgi:hypothetical protein